MKKIFPIKKTKKDFAISSKSAKSPNHPTIKMKLNIMDRARKPPHPVEGLDALLLFSLPSVVLEEENGEEIFFSYIIPYQEC